MNTAFIYFFPALVDLVVALLQFVCTARAPKWGASATETGLLVVVWSLFYMGACYWIGKKVTPRNSGFLLQWSSGLLLVISLVFLKVNSLYEMYLLMAITGVATALFFVPFQIFMKEVDDHGSKSLSYTTAFYTFAWSSGYAWAPLVSGFLMMLGAQSGRELSGWKYCFILSGMICLTVNLGVWWMRHRAGLLATQSGSEKHGDATSLPDYERYPSYAWLAWIVGGIGILAYSAIRTVFQEYAHALSLTDSMKGMIQFALSMMQGLVGLSFYRSRDWMYSVWPVLILGLSGLLGLACFSWGSGAWFFLLGAIFYGVYSGGFFFYFTFHALTHSKKRSRNVSVNEIVFGVASLIGPLAGGLLADRISSTAPYLIFGCLMIPVLIFQSIVHFRNRSIIPSSPLNRVSL